MDKFRKSHLCRDSEFQSFTESHSISRTFSIFERQRQCSRESLQKFQRDTENYMHLHIFRNILGKWHRIFLKVQVWEERNGIRDFSACQECLSVWHFASKYKAQWVPHLSVDIVCGSLARIQHEKGREEVKTGQSPPGLCPEASGTKGAKTCFRPPPRGHLLNCTFWKVQPFQVLGCKQRALNSLLSKARS